MTCFWLMVLLLSIWVCYLCVRTWIEQSRWRCRGCWCFKHPSELLSSRGCARCVGGRRWRVQRNQLKRCSFRLFWDTFWGGETMRVLSNTRFCVFFDSAECIGDTGSAHSCSSGVFFLVEDRGQTHCKTRFPSFGEFAFLPGKYTLGV